MTDRTAVIYGWRAPELSADAAAFFRAAKPWGFILFTEACKSRAQVRKLADQMREAVEGEVVIFIDQEGGRVARLKAPEWPTFPAAAQFGKLYARNKTEGLEACRLGHRLMAHELADLGVRADCAPCLDLPADGADPIIGDRAFGTDPATIAALGKAAIEGLHAGGVASVIKHLPGHGRANVDSHLHLPRVDAGLQALAQDFACFSPVADAPMAMTAHVLYEAIDENRPATTSPEVIRRIIRGEIGFTGLLMSDDLGMKALSGTWWDKTEAALAAGCDVILHCSGDLVEMEEVAGAAPMLGGESLLRAMAAEKIAFAPPQPFDAEAGWARFRKLLGLTAGPGV
jgi:beta-N-acetylhexosaminidase